MTDEQTSIRAIAPTGEIVEYDRRYLALYAALLDADRRGTKWREAATTLIGLDVDADDAKACWQSHLERARWIAGEGLGGALAAFNLPRGKLKDE